MLEPRHILVLVWLSALLIALGLGGVVPIAALIALARPVVAAWRWLRIRRFRRRLRAVAAARNVAWREPRVVDETRLEWPKTSFVIGGQTADWIPSLEPKPMTDEQIVEWLRPLGGA